jgi:hypothetical protein
MPVRIIPLSHRSNITGRQPFIPGTRSIGHESALERDFVTVCRFDPDVLGVEEQPVTIDWVDTCGRKRHYTPDYRVVRRTHTEIVEVKYRADLWSKWPHYKPVFIMGRRWASARGMRFRIATERQIRGPFLTNAKRLVPRMHEPVSAAVERHIIEVLDRLQPICFSGLVDAVTSPDIPREAILSTLWSLIARRTVTTAFDVEVGGNSALSLPRLPS